MLVGLIGAGNMARALARGWREPIVCFDPAHERARGLVDEVGGEALESNAAVAERADVVVLCHKPAQLAEVAGQIGARAKAIASILGGTTLAELRAVYPATPVFRFIPNTPVEVRRGVLCYALGSGDGDPSLEKGILGLFARVGRVIAVEERSIDTAMGLMSTAPAYVALIVEAWVDAGVRRGLAPDQAAEMVVAAVGGTAELIAARGMDTLAVRREVTSPGGVTARGLLELERGGVRVALADALDAVLDR